MKNIFSKLIIVSALASASTAFAEDTVRIIVTKKDGTSAVGHQNSGVFSQSMPANGPVISNDVRVPLSEVSQTISLLEKDPDVIAVERDVIVRPLQQKASFSTYPMSSAQQNARGENMPNDPDFQYQSYFMPRSDEYLTGSDILGAWENGPQKVRPRIAVMDGGFLSEGRYDDIKPVANYSFVSDGDIEYGDTAYDNSEPSQDCEEDGHGIGVYGVIGAIANNNKHIAGIVDADMYMLRVMRCGSGSMYDSAQALRWAAGGEVEGLPTLDTPVDVATFSLGARSGCPTFMQSAIDFAVSRGVKVFVAAGNDGENVSVMSPANCRSNVTVGGVKRGTGDRAEFSNFGDRIDIMAQATSVSSLSGLESEVAFWSGTSFSAPIVAGIYGLAKAYAPSVDDKILDKLMRLTAHTIDAPVCASGGCGEGLIDAKRFVGAASKIENGNFAVIKSALNDTALCDSTPYLMATGVKSRLCNAFSVVIDGDIFPQDAGDTVNYRLYQWDPSASFDYNDSQLIYAGPELKYMVSDLDTKMETGIVRCVNGACDVSMVFPVTLNNTGRPSQCDE